VNTELHNDPRLPLAWGPWFSHEYINYHAALALPGLMNLPPVQVQPNPGFDDPAWPIGPKHVDLYKESARETRRLDPFWAFDYEQRNGDYLREPPLGVGIEPWKVLVIYSTEPDLHPDCDLMLHEHQTITGGSHGWRHLHFKTAEMNIGVAPESFRHHVDLSRQAFAHGNHYWGWRFLSRASHYLADLGHPFHVKPAPAKVMDRYCNAPEKLTRLISAMHQSHEVFAERRFREGFPAFGQALFRGARSGSTSAVDVFEALDGYMAGAAERLSPIFNHLLDCFGQELVSVFDRMDEYRHLDAMTQTMLCSEEAARVIFRPDRVKDLEYLESMTTEILFEVGGMLGRLLSGIVATGQPGER
jgi:hypothetical protein